MAERSLNRRLSSKQPTNQLIVLHIFADSCLPINSSKFYGQQGGRSFDDKSSWQCKNITAIRLECSMYYMHSIQIKYGDTWAEKHGSGRQGCGQNCRNYTKTLTTNERITNVKLLSAKSFGLVFIHRAKIYTNHGELISCGGIGFKADRIYYESQGFRLQYISGRSGDFVDGLRFHWSEK